MMIFKKNVASILVVISISFICIAQFWVGFHDGIITASGHAKDVFLYESWKENNNGNNDDDDDITTNNNTNNNNNNNKNNNNKNNNYALKKRWRMMKRRHDYIDAETNEIIADVSDFLDFAIIGNPKTGTTFFATWLNRHRDLYLPQREMRFFLEPDGPVSFVKEFMHLYRRKRGNKQLGYKCPADVREIQSLIHLRNHFPKTKLIVGKLSFGL